MTTVKQLNAFKARQKAQMEKAKYVGDKRRQHNQAHFDRNVAIQDKKNAKYSFKVMKSGQADARDDLRDSIATSVVEKFLYQFLPFAAKSKPEVVELKASQKDVKRQWKAAVKERVAETKTRKEAAEAKLPASFDIIHLGGIIP